MRLILNDPTSFALHPLSHDQPLSYVQPNHSSIYPITCASLCAHRIHLCRRVSSSRVIITRIVDRFYAISFIN